MTGGSSYLNAKSLITLLIFTLCLATGLKADGGDYEDGQLVCEMQPGFSISLIDSLFGTTVVDHIDETNAYLLMTQPGVNAESLAVVISLRPEVLYCSANYFLAAPEPFQRSQPFLDAQ